MNWLRVRFRFRIMDGCWMLDVGCWMLDARGHFQMAGSQKDKVGR